MLSSSLKLGTLISLVLVSQCAPRSTNSGQSSSSIIFTDQPASGHVRNGHNRPATSSGQIHFGETNASSDLVSNGTHQVNRGQATGQAFVQQTSPDGKNVQSADISAVVGSHQEGQGGGSNSADNTANINVTLQQINAPVVNVGEGHEGVVIINNGEPAPGERQSQQVINNRPISAETNDSSRCRYWCRRPSGTLYCCDDGTDQLRNSAKEEIHGGYCPPARLVCPNGTFFRHCAHDGHCAASDKCCYDTCANRHICKRPDKQSTAL